MLANAGLNLKAAVALRKESVDRNHLDDVDGGDLVQSLSARRAWIEISCRLNQSVSAQWSLSARRAWIEMYLTILKIYATLSLSARRAWIEIRLSMSAAPPARVALRKESVDRNVSNDTQDICNAVALRKESVDRNSGKNTKVPESVTSLSARRAWIEIFCVVR